MWHIHDDLKAPPDATPLWRYMDFTKFVSILERRALFFCGLPSLPDPYEGVATKAYAEGLQTAWKDVASDHPLKKISPNVAALLMDTHVQNRSWVYVSCWHMNSIESAAMWSLYLKTGEGIAIRTTFGRFRQSFERSRREIMGSMVRYINFDTELPESLNPIDWARLKRKSFEHENEFRGIAFTPPHDIPPEDGDARGIHVPVDLDMLIADVYVAPHAPEWLVSLVRRMLKWYRLEKTVHHSALYKRPPYLDLGDSGVRFEPPKDHSPDPPDNHELE